MKSWTTRNDFKIYQVLTGRTNAFLVTNGMVNILVDTGKQQFYEELLMQLKAIPVAPENIHYLILTHTHYDHCQSAQRLKEKTGCAIVMSKFEVESALQGYSEIPKGTQWITKFLSALGKRIGPPGFSYQPFSADHTIAEEFNFKEAEIRVIATPGHTKGSVSIIIDNEIAIVGDVLFRIFPGSIFPPYADDVKILTASWEKLLKTNCKLFLPGHGKAVSSDLLKRKYKKYSER